MDLDKPAIAFRRARSGDQDLIERTLQLASGWRSDEPAPLSADINPAYFAEWGRPDDIGMFAFDGPWFAGGAYARRVGPADGTYGYVAPDLWELSIGVESPQRQKGIGRLLIESLKALSLERRVVGLSLSVELDNMAARRLYEVANFTVVEERKSDVLMSWSLDNRSR